MGTTPKVTRTTTKVRGTITKVTGTNTKVRGTMTKVAHPITKVRGTTTAGAGTTTPVRRTDTTGGEWWSSSRCEEPGPFRAGTNGAGWPRPVAPLNAALLLAARGVPPRAPRCLYNRPELGQFPRNNRQDNQHQMKPNKKPSRIRPTMDQAVGLPDGTS